MLDNKVIIFDDSCPMCRVYTYWFVAWGFLKPENRVGFAHAPTEITSYVDLDRGRHEIPLFDRQTKETIYGLKALTHVLADRWTWLKPIFASKFFWFIFYPVYQIITYNRRVIAGCKSCDGFDCSPDMNHFYRGIYLGLSAAIVSGVGWLLLMSGSVVAGIGFAVIVGFSLLGFVVGIPKRIFAGSHAAWDYMGNYCTVLILVSLSLIPVAGWWQSNPLVAYSFLVFALLLGVEELNRRTD